jgi:hypothetical protein
VKIFYDILLFGLVMTIQKITKKRSLICAIRLGRGRYARATDRSCILHPAAKQNSISKVAAAPNKCYKTP